jgi:hypothetical protein
LTVLRVGQGCLIVGILQVQPVIDAGVVRADKDGLDNRFGVKLQAGWRREEISVKLTL